MTGNDASTGEELTPREREVLTMVAAGRTNREIGEALFISESTAGVHVSHLMAKLGVGSRTEAAAWAYRAGLVAAVPGALATDAPSAEAAPTIAPEPSAGWFGLVRDQLRGHPRQAAAMGGVAVLAVIAVALAIVVLGGRQPAEGDLSSASASPSVDASASPSVSASIQPSATASTAESPTPVASPTPIPLPSGTWSVTGTMFEYRDFHTATLLRDGTVLVAGGSDFMANTRTSAEIYDPNSGEWRPTGDLVEGRQGHSAVLLGDGTVLVTGGSSSSAEAGIPGHNVASAELYDRDTGSWRATTPMTTARYGHTATLLEDGTVLITGGSAPAPAYGVLASAEIYDPRTATWTTVAPMADGRVGHTATLLNDGTVLVAGGAAANSTSVAVATLFDPETRTWSAAGRMVIGRHEHTATMLADGTVLVAGGGSDLGPQASAEAYHPNTKSWTPVGSMADPCNFGATATLLRDETVLVVGCYFPQSASAEVYDPRNGQWAAAAPMIQGRVGFAATLLSNGDVLVSGGSPVGSNGIIPQVTFLYDPNSGS